VTTALRWHEGQYTEMDAVPSSALRTQIALS
jgi:hypothetical protein